MSMDTDPSYEQMQTYLASSPDPQGFASLGAALQGRILDALTQMQGMERSTMLQRLHDMTRADREQVVGSLVHRGAGALQDGPQGDTRHYTVKPGDSLSKICRAYNIGLKALLAANPQIKNPDLIHPNQVINLP